MNQGNHVYVQEDSTHWHMKRIQSARVVRVMNCEMYLDSETNLPFYYDVSTDASQWDPPNEWIASNEAKHPQSAEEGWKYIRERSVCINTSSTATHPYDLTNSTTTGTISNDNISDKEWVQYYDNTTEKYFYYNNKTGISTWELPCNPCDNQWIRCFDYDSNSVYYCNDATHESVWELPENAVLIESYDDVI